MSYRDGGYSSRSRSRSRSPRGGEREYRPRTKEPDSAPKVFVGNIAHDTEESDFRSHFEQCGKIVEILMPRDPHSGRSKGYGFVTYEDFGTMDKAIAKLHGSTLLGNELKVDRANERKERPKYNDDRRAGGGYNSNSYDRTGTSSYGRSTYDSRGAGGYGSGYDRGGHDSRDRGGYDSRDRGGSSYRSAGYEDRGSAPGRKPVGYRCRITGLAREIGWQLLKDFLRQAGDVTYANVDPDGLGVGEYQTYAECRDAIDKLTGAALDGHIVTLKALNFDYETGERLDHQTPRSFDMNSGRGNPYDFSSKDRSRSHGAGGGGGGGGSFVQRRDGGGYDRGNSYSNGRDNGYSDRRNDNRSSGYDREDRPHSGVVYSNAHNAPGSSSRYGGGGSGWTGGSSSKYGGGSSSRYAGGNDEEYRGGGGPERSYSRSTSGDRHGPYDRPTGSR